MVARVFIDTNVIIYGRDVRDTAKQAMATLWLSALARTGAGVTNLQVLNEFTMWLTRRDPHRAIAVAKAEVDDLRVFGDSAVTDVEADLAWEVRRQHGFQWFDCLHVACAHRLGCTHLLSEDMCDGATFRRVRIVNPFTNRIESILGSD
jgi:predicted nucleic acid-binding protein